VLRVLFENHLQSSRAIVDTLNAYIRAIQSLQFDQASDYINTCLAFVENEKKLAEDACDETRLNQLYVVREFATMFADYSAYWAKVLGRDFTSSWSTLQEVQSQLRVVKKFCGTYSESHLSLIERQVVALEKLYPYTIFASPELIISDIKCPICGELVDSLKCPHISGELYGGEMAYGIVGKIDSVQAVCLVEHPADKGCVIQLDNTPESFPAIAHLADLIDSHTFSPWQFSGVSESVRQKPIAEFGEIGRNDKCPCGSGKKLKHCCLRVGYIEVPQIEILVSEPGMPLFRIVD
jgi:hypothetical protein